MYAEVRQVYYKLLRLLYTGQYACVPGKRIYYGRVLVLHMS